MLASTEPFVQVIFDLESLRLAFGRICIMGDGSFSARPHVAAGTAKAAADPWAVRDALRDNGEDLDRALQIWQDSQVALGRSVVERSRAMVKGSQFEDDGAGRSDSEIRAARTGELSS